MYIVIIVKRREIVSTKWHYYQHFSCTIIANMFCKNYFCIPLCLVRKFTCFVKMNRAIDKKFVCFQLGNKCSFCKSQLKHFWSCESLLSNNKNNKNWKGQWKMSHDHGTISCLATMRQKLQAQFGLGNWNLPSTSTCFLNCMS